MFLLHFLQHENHLNQKKEIVIETQGKSIDKFNEPVIVDDHYHHHHYLQQPRNINKQSQNTDTLDFLYSNGVNCAYRKETPGGTVCGPSSAAVDRSRSRRQLLDRAIRGERLGTSRTV